MNKVRRKRQMQYKTSPGFTLVEVIVVMVIVAILATGVVFMFSNPISKVKGQAFTLLGDLNMARSEAVSENVNVRVTFLPGATDGYRIWVDEDDPPNNTYEAGTDTLIQERTFPEELQFYDTAVTGGPDKKPFFPWDDLDMADPDYGDGIEFEGENEFIFTSRGTAEDTGSDPLNGEGFVIIHYADHEKLRAKPYAVVISEGSGTVRIARFNFVGDTPPWRTK